jgi:hypothetical protein
MNNSAKSNHPGAGAKLPPMLVASRQEEPVELHQRCQIELAPRNRLQVLACIAPPTDDSS